MARIRPPAATVLPEKIRSAGRLFARSAGGAFTSVVAGAVIGRGPPGARCSGVDRVARPCQADGPGTQWMRSRALGVVPCYLMSSMAEATCSLSELEMGAEPAASAATFWPSSLVTYERYDLTSSPWVASSYDSQAIR